jgi:hypothetical protein
VYYRGRIFETNDEERVLVLTNCADFEMTLRKARAKKEREERERSERECV